MRYLSTAGTRVKSLSVPNNNLGLVGSFIPTRSALVSRVVCQLPPETVDEAESALIVLAKKLFSPLIYMDRPDWEPVAWILPVT